MHKLHIVIPAAGAGRRMKSYGPKALIKLNNQTVINRSLNIINAIYPLSKVTVVVGFEAEKVVLELKDKVKFVFNYDYLNTNVAHSISLALSQRSIKEALIVYGDLVFNTQTLKGFYPEASTAIVSSKSCMNDEEVGVTVVDGIITRWSYGLPVKWAQMVYLKNKELELFRKFSNGPRSAKFFGYEILNMVIEAGGIIEAAEPLGMDIVDVDTSKDIEIAKRITQ